VYIAVFGCLYSRMTHLEVIKDKKTESIIGALTKLGCIYGPPSCVTVDQDAAEITALDLEIMVYQAANVINSTPLGSMQRNLTSDQLCPVKPVSCMIGAERPVLKSSMMFPASLNSTSLLCKAPGTS
jgi:hypothetical protein